MVNSAILADSPEWYYPFEEASGAPVDASTHGVVGAWTGTPTYGLTGPRPGSSAIGTNPGDYVTLTYTSASSSAQSVEGWFRTTSTGLVVLEQNRGNTPAGVGLALQLSIGPSGFGAGAGQVTAYFNKTSVWKGIHSTAQVNDGQWHHLAATWQGSGAISTSQLAIYIDGLVTPTVADTSAGSASAPITGSGNMALLNAKDQSRAADVDIFDMAYFHTTLSAARVLAHYIGDVPFVSDFHANVTSGSSPLTVAFADDPSGGTGTVNSWAWDFGDGSTSTSQNPTHIYALTGTYTVALTMGTDDAETDTEIKVGYIRVGAVYVPPEQSLAVIEIKASTPGSARWGSAHWGEDVWATAAWQDVTPQSVDAVVRWGSHSPEYGILAETEAASWIVDTFDPQRLLDPGNPDGPFAADLRAGLPIRIRHRGTIVRQGVCETIAYFHKDQQGAIRVTDNLSLMARTPVPEDSILSDTLRARARDVIAAAGLSLTVEPDPPSGDPALAPRLEGDRSVWRHISDAAQQTLHIAYIDRIGTIKFRSWATPYDRSRGVDETQLVDLGTIVQTRGLYSVVQAQQTVGDGGLLLERRLTPTPRYGSVTYSRTDETPDADAWADAVLADRGLQGVQWIPGEIYPLTANDVEYFATLEAVERFGVSVANAVPIVSIDGIIVGGEFRVVSKRDDSAIWSFELELAQTASTPLYTDTDPAEFLLNEFGDGYLYPG